MPSKKKSHTLTDLERYNWSRRTFCPKITNCQSLMSLSEEFLLGSISIFSEVAYRLSSSSCNRSRQAFSLSKQPEKINAVRVSSVRFLSVIVLCHFIQMLDFRKRQMLLWLVTTATCCQLHFPYHPQSSQALSIHSRAMVWACAMSSLVIVSATVSLAPSASLAPLAKAMLYHM